MRNCNWLILALAAGFSFVAGTAHARPAVLIFKDGFVLHGDLIEPGSYTGDAPSGQVFWISKGSYVLSADARRIYFSPNYLQDAINQDVDKFADVIKLESRLTRINTKPIAALTHIIGADPWNERWERNFQLYGPFGKVTAQQRLGLLTPQYARVDAKSHNWSAYYLTSELGPAVVRSLLHSYPELKKSDRESPEHRLRIARLLVQAGWFNQAEEELTALLKANPGEKENVEAVRDTLKKLRHFQLFEDLERAHQAGQFNLVNEVLSKFPNEGVDEKILAGIRSLRATYDTGMESLTAAKSFLKSLPPKCPPSTRPLFKEAAEAILAELDMGNAGRLEAFLTLAQQAERDLKNTGKTDKEPNQILSLAVSGWLLGKDLAEAKLETATRLWLSRKFVQGYLKEDDETERDRLLKNYLQQRSDVLPIDEFAQLISLLPPPAPEKKIGTEPMSLRTDLVLGPKKGYPYLVQLPPEYHHGRPFPVLIALHQGGEPPKAMLDRLSPFAAQNGYILVAPEWEESLDHLYGYSNAEHIKVTDALRDIRRRFNVDSDRVFLMGAGEGANMAYDVGLSHPDLFAGVMPISGQPYRFSERYWPNAQLLPFYVVIGDWAGNYTQQNREQFKKWVPLGYPAICAQYKGRGIEWFAGELPFLFDWMNHKKDRFKRAAGVPELGKLGGSLNQEYQTLRSTDNRFYWISTDSIRPVNVLDGSKWTNNINPATIQGRIAEGNYIHLTTRGLMRVTIWLAKDMIDFSKPVTVRINNTFMIQKGKVQPSYATLLEDLFNRNDRQRLFWAKLEFDKL